VLRDLAERQGLIDERREVEQHFAAALAFNTKLVEAAPVGILTYRISGACISCNAAAAQIIGASVEQLRQQNFRSIESWRQSGLFDLAERTIATRAPHSSQIVIVTSYARSLWLLVRLAVFRSQDEDMPLLVVGDISELKRVEEELVETERVLRASQVELRKLSRAVEQGPSSVIITDRSGAIDYVNPAFSAMSGYAFDEVVGQNPPDIQGWGRDGRHVPRTLGHHHDRRHLARRAAQPAQGRDAVLGARDDLPHPRRRRRHHACRVDRAAHRRAEGGRRRRE